VLPQVKSVLLNLLIIIAGGPFLGAYFAWQTGELTSLQQLPGALQHGIFASIMMAIGWLLMRSPWAGKVTELLQVKTSPSGVVQETSIKITEPPVGPK
jgi:hypothetical protein